MFGQKDLQLLGGSDGCVAGHGEGSGDGIDENAQRGLNIGSLQSKIIKRGIYVVYIYAVYRIDHKEGSICCILLIWSWVCGLGTHLARVFLHRSHGRLVVVLAVGLLLLRRQLVPHLLGLRERERGRGV